MKKSQKRRKCLSLIIALLMVFSCVPGVAFAEESATEPIEEQTSVVEETTITEESETEVSIVDSGTCGGNLTWELDSDGVLTISGSGEMYEYGSEGFPWDGYKTYLKKLVLEEGITSISMGAFSNCNGFTGDLIIPDSVTSIEDSAFSKCNGFTGDLIIPDSVTSIGEGAFIECKGFNGILKLPIGIKKIEFGTFNGCSGFTGHLTIPNSVETIGEVAFSGCSGFTGDLVIPNSVVYIQEAAFSDCYGFDGNLIISNKLISIEQAAFNYCSGINRIYIPDNNIFFDDAAFYSNTSSTFYIYKGSTADNYFSSTSANEKLVYLNDSAATFADEKSLYFKAPTIAMSTEDIINIKDLLVSSFEVSQEELAIKLSDDSLVLYSNGQLAALGVNGECEITIEAGELSATATLIFVDNISDDPSIMFNDVEKTITCGDVIYNEPLFSSYISATEEIKWSSSNSNIASVDDHGYVKALESGEATITAALDSGSSSSYTVIVENPLQQIDIIPIDTMDVGESKKLSYFMYPYNASDLQDTVITCDNEDVLSVDSNGYLTALKSGNATITVTNGAKSDQLVVAVKKLLKGISLSDTKVTAYKGEKVQLEALLNPVDAEDVDNISWESSDSKIASVDDNGLVSVNGAGIVTITASVNGFKSQCTFLCPNVPLEEFSFGNYTENLKCGDTSQLIIVPTPVNTTDVFNAVWSSSNEDVIKVDSNGNIEAVAAGSAVITATVNSFENKCKITVNHDWDDDYTIDKEATCTEEGSKSIHCSKCDATKDVTPIETLNHTYKTVTTKATTAKDGKIHAVCDCGAIKSKTTIYRPKTFALSTTKYTYNGEVKTPAVTVKDAKGKTLVKNKDYTVSYASGRKYVGRYKVTVTFKGNYTGEKNLYYTIVPKVPTRASAYLTYYYGQYAGYDDVKFSWSKVTGASGYYVYCKKSTSSSYTYLTRTTRTYARVKNLTDGVKYYFKVVPYYKSGDNRYTSLSYKTASVYTLKRLNTPTVTKSGSKVKVKWNNIAGESGYQISKSTKKSGTNIVVTYATTSGTYKTIKAPKGKTYYYKVRAYKTITENGKVKKVYGPWSYAKSYKLR